MDQRLNLQALPHERELVFKNNPMDADNAKKRQELWAKHLGVHAEYTNRFGMKLRLIPPGEFMMGSISKEVE